MNFKDLALLACFVVMIANFSQASLVSVTSNSPADGATICGTKSANFVFTPISGALDTKNCSLDISNTITWNTTTISNATQNTMSGAVSNWGAYTWQVTCYNTSSTAVQSAVRNVGFVLQPCNMNTSQGLGESTINGIKGSAQFIAQIVDQTLNTQNGVIEIGALAIVIIVLGFAFAQAKKAKQHGQRLM